ncbi:DUF1289 domain-containing protein [Pseudomonas schmalbachii]|uniref:DUF1289 domain-containing protein n=1 Tax=Pseudomonas schmalbachii TaxID=2816993 RepID=A0ABS3TR85_9PSED|nr:DUF1289 domain-containing protein [Pseudomonas schmalbachii]MBO3276168.1 DUF1289 domain-containing protein [Pseudomonas schmalbachii]
MSISPASDGAPDAPVQSPCRRQCCLDAADICLGCGRSLGEILEWRDADEMRRREILRAAQERRNSRPDGA